MLKKLDHINPDVDTVVICTDVQLLKYFIQTKLEKYYTVDKNYSIAADTGILFKKAKSDSLVAPLAGDKWLIISNLDKVGIDTATEYLNYGNGNAVTLLYTDKYITFKKFINTEKFKNVQITTLPLYLAHFDFEDIPYLCKEYNVKLTDDLIEYLNRNYRYDTARVMELLSKMKIGVEINTKSDLIDEIGLGGVTPSSFTLDLLRIFQPDGRFITEVQPITDKRVRNAVKKYLNILHDLSLKINYNLIYAQMLSTLKGIIDIKMLILNGEYRKSTKAIPDGYTDQQKRRIKALQRFDSIIREEISLNRVLYLFELFDKSPNTFDYEFKLMNIITDYIGSWEMEKVDS